MHGAQKLVIVFSKVVKVASPITVCRQSFGEMIFFFLCIHWAVHFGVAEGHAKKSGDKPAGWQGAQTRGKRSGGVHACPKH